MVIPKYGVLFLDVQQSNVILFEDEYSTIDFISSIVYFAIFSNINVMSFLSGNFDVISFKKLSSIKLKLCVPK